MENKDMEDFFKLLTASPELANGVISEFVKKYKPILYRIVGELFNVYKDLVNNYEYFETMAKYNRRKFYALTNNGFTEDQAMAIMIADEKQLREHAKNTSGTSVKLNK